MIYYQIYVYERQLLRFYDHKHNIAGYYTETEEETAIKDMIRAASFEPRQLILSRITDSNSEIIAISLSGKIQYIRQRA